MTDKKFGGIELLREKLNDSVTAGEEPLKIILELAEIIGEISGEKNFYSRIQGQIFTTYGKVFENKFALEKEIETVTARLKKIEAALNSDDFDEEEKQRITFALERHKKEIERLESLKENAKTS